LTLTLVEPGISWKKDR